MIDISLKARLGKDKEKIVLALEKKGAKIKKGKEEVDRVFFKNLLDGIDTSTIFNIIKEEDKSLLCLKRNDGENGKLIKLESLVADEEVIAEMITSMGYEEKFEIKKKRTKYLLDGMIVNIDYIEDLDYFIEINKTVSNEDEEKEVRTNIENLFDYLNIKKDEYILDSYEILKYNLNN